MKRRKFIYFGLAGTVAASLPVSYCGNRDATGEPAFLTSLLKPAQVKEIGKAYLQQFPSESDRKKLSALLSAGEKRPSASSLNIKIQEDFKKGNVVVVQGWVISVTEARQSALYYLNP
jgi:hypothetical protein